MCFYVVLFVGGSKDMELSLTQQFRIILRSLRDTYGFTPIGGTDDTPLFGASVPPGRYEALAGNKLIRVMCYSGVLARPLIIY
jgi:hypothetical protein